MVWFNFDDFFKSRTKSIKCNLVWIDFELIYNIRKPRGIIVLDL